MTLLKPLHRAAALALGFAVFAHAPAALAVGERIALIIGNGDYAAAPVLAQPANDAEDLAAAFAEIGFDVIQLTNVEGRAMRRAVRDFDERADDASVAVIYFAGHSLAVDGVNYLVPVDAQLRRDTYVDDEAVPLSQLIAAVDGAKNIRLVMLATTRDDPLTGTMKRSIRKRIVVPGLAAIDPTRSAVVAYAIDQGVNGGSRNSAYAAAVLAHLKTPAIGLADFLEAVGGDVEATSRSAPVVIGSASATVPIVPDAATMQQLRDRQAESRETEIADAFRRAEKLSTVEAWDAFLQFCPAEGTADTFCAAASASRLRLVASGRGSGDGPAAVGDGSGIGAPMRADRAAVPAYEDAGATCDRLAAHSYDQDKPATVAGTALSLLGATAEEAIQACLKASEQASGERRYVFQLGRAYHAAGRFDEALARYTEAAEAGSAIAMNNRGLLHATGAGTPKNPEAALHWYRKGAEAGNVTAMGNLAGLYYNGAGVERDFAQAREWYARAAEGGNVLAMNALALLYQDGAGGPQDIDAARALFETAAEAGYASAINNLARLYNFGRGVPVDYVRARQLYEQAADLGESAAMVNLGLMYENGEGVRRDYRTARGWYEQAAALDNAGAMTNLGILYQYGRGVTESFDEARAWYERAAELGDAAAMANLAYMYDGGRGVPVDKFKARYWYLKGAEAGNGPAMASVGYLFANGQGGPQDFGKAMEWYRKGADIGNAGAMTNVGFMYESGWGVEQDYGEAIEWYMRGAAAGNAIAMANIGLMYEQGRGVETDIGLAFDWYRKGAEAGNAQAMASLAYFYSNGTGTEADPAIALDWYTKAANLGNITAMHNLGVAYKDGLGTERNLRRAADLFIQSMQARNAWTFDQFRDHPENYPVEVLAEIERYLVSHGLMRGEPDGEVDDETRAGLTALQQQVGG
ncbi:caspase family protein [Bauldia litoralis]|uniref:TPR repeat n=1 Tax=Bauldia litoralis TaxID=665467 RepID=A0A1G6DWX0_9HYPH|nr:caspase family protein [Bauldia litoralis]SDB49265.1 TPR repeat [Bauldia litoralis]